MYVSITGNKGNQDVYIKQSYRKDNGKTSSRIYKKLGKYNDLLAQFSGDETAMMDWAKKEAEKEIASPLFTVISAHAFIDKMEHAEIIWR